jgi:peptidyl-prolyl cis-trans isomerase A (cyclophilin A)
MMKQCLAAAMLLIATGAFAEAPVYYAKSIKGDTVTLIMKTSMGDITIDLYRKIAPRTVDNFLGLAFGLKEFIDPKTGNQVKRKYYDGLIFHRVIDNFMLQTGCPLGTGFGGPGFTFADEINANAVGIDKLKVLDEANNPHPYLLCRSQQDFLKTVMAPLYKKMGIGSQEQLEQRKDEITKKLTGLTLKECYENLGYVYNSKLRSPHLTRGIIAMANSGANTNGSQFFINVVDTPWLDGKHTAFGRVVKGMDVVDAIANVPKTSGNVPLTPVTIISIDRKKK